MHQYNRIIINCCIAIVTLNGITKSSKTSLMKIQLVKHLTISHFYHTYKHICQDSICNLFHVHVLSKVFYIYIDNYHCLIFVLNYELLFELHFLLSNLHLQSEEVCNVNDFDYHIKYFYFTFIFHLFYLEHIFHLIDHQEYYSFDYIYLNL